MMYKVIQTDPIEVYERFRDIDRTYDTLLGVANTPDEAMSLVSTYLANKTIIGTVSYHTIASGVIVDYSAHNKRLYCTNLRLQM